MKYTTKVGCFKDINIYFICLILQTLPMTKNSNVDKEIDSDEHNDKLQHNNTYNGDRNSPNRGMNEIQYLYILNSYYKLECHREINYIV